MTSSNSDHETPFEIRYGLFLKDWLAPVVADGKLMPDEESPLLFAAMVYGIFFPSRNAEFCHLPSPHMEQAQEATLDAIRFYENEAETEENRDQRIIRAWVRLRNATDEKWYHKALVEEVQLHKLKKETEKWASDQLSRQAKKEHPSEFWALQIDIPDKRVKACFGGHLFSKVRELIKNARKTVDAERSQPEALVQVVVTHPTSSNLKEYATPVPALVSVPVPTSVPTHGATVVKSQTDNVPDKLVLTQIEYSEKQLREIGRQIMPCLRDFADDKKRMELVNHLGKSYKNNPNMIFNPWDSNAKPGAGCLRPSISKDEGIWFIGDVHGDISALLLAVKYIFSLEKKTTLVFLGDLLDRGTHAGLSFAFLMNMALGGTRICLLAGNHDAGLSKTDDGRFVSSIQPCEFVTALNGNRHGDPSYDKLAQLVIEVYRCAPRALLFDDGLLAAHGGIPHVDLHEKIKSRHDLNREECLQDFIWTRAHDRAPRKRPNRTTKGCQFGIQDFHDFCAVTEKAGAPVRRMIRGHDHISRRYRHHANYGDRPILTINTFGQPCDEDIWDADKTPFPCVARYVQGSLPEVHQLRASPDWLHEFLNQSDQKIFNMAGDTPENE